GGRSHLSATTPPQASRFSRPALRRHSPPQHLDLRLFEFHPSTLQPEYRAFGVVCSANQRVQDRQLQRKNAGRLKPIRAMIAKVLNVSVFATTSLSLEAARSKDC